MRTIRTLLLVLLASLFASSKAKTQENSSTSLVPHLEKRGSATQLIVNSKPFLVLGGELHNSSSSSLLYMAPIWPRLTAMHLNTVLAPVSWELTEPEEGKFDFRIVDGLIDGASASHLRLVFLWFGSWKNTFSSYAPEWVKRNIERFPRVQTSDGRGTERLSPFSQDNQRADARAFAALMRHIKQKDGDLHTVVMVQVENEVGVIPEARDHSAAADKAFSGPVPEELMLWLKQHSESLDPEFHGIWESAGGKESGTWTQVFGKTPLTEDLFMAWYYARYINAVAAAGKSEYALPMFTNAALIRPNYEPGQYNSGGPLPHSLDLWRAGAPAIDFFSPDIYLDNFAEWSRKYHRAANPLFIPEAVGGETGAANVFYAIGQLQAIGFSPFGIDGPESRRSGPDDSNAAITASYALLEQLAPLILKKQSEGGIATILLEGENQRAGRVSLGDYTFTAVRANPAEAEKRGAAIFVEVGPDEYLVAGAGNLTITFSPAAPGAPIAGITSIDEQVLQDGSWIQRRRLNGDENGQGQVLRLKGAESPVIFRLKLYRYR